APRRLDQARELDWLFDWANVAADIGLRAAALRTRLPPEHRAEAVYGVRVNQLELDGVAKHAGQGIKEVAAGLGRPLFGDHLLAPPLAQARRRNLVEPHRTEMRDDRATLAQVALALFSRRRSKMRGVLAQVALRELGESGRLGAKRYAEAAD